MQAVALQPVGRIGEKPARVMITQGGLPVGLVVERHEIHVYAHGRELASNVSKRRVDVTSADARDFALTQFKMAHPRATVPPAPAPDFVARAVGALIASGHGSQTVDVDIDLQGNATACRVVAPTSGEDTARIETAIRESWFFAALERGQPIASRATFQLNELR